MSVTSKTSVLVKVTFRDGGMSVGVDNLTSLFTMLALASAEADEEALNSLGLDLPVRREIVRLVSDLDHRGRLRKPPAMQFRSKGADDNSYLWLVNERSIAIEGWGHGSKWVDLSVKSSVCLALATAFAVETGRVVASGYEQSDLKSTIDAVISSQIDSRTLGVQRWLRRWIVEKDLQDPKIDIAEQQVCVAATLPSRPYDGEY